MAEKKKKKKLGLLNGKAPNGHHDGTAIESIPGVLRLGKDVDYDKEEARLQIELVKLQELSLIHI